MLESTYRAEMRGRAWPAGDRQLLGHSAGRRGGWRAGRRRVAHCAILPLRHPAVTLSLSGTPGRRPRQQGSRCFLIQPLRLCPRWHFKGGTQLYAVADSCRSPGSWRSPRRRLSREPVGSGKANFILKIYKRDNPMVSLSLTKSSLSREGLSQKWNPLSAQPTYPRVRSLLKLKSLWEV